VSATRRSPRRSLVAASIVAGLGMLGAGCQSAASKIPPATARPPHGKVLYAEAGNRRVRIPTEIHGQLPAEAPGATQAGQQILITPSGIHPSLLLATQGIPVVWTNLTRRPQRVIFTNAQGESGLIPPGGTFSIPTPRSESYTFRTASGLKGVLNVDPNFPSLP